MSRLTAGLGAVLGAAGILAGASPLAAQAGPARHRMRYEARWMERGPIAAVELGPRRIAAQRMLVVRPGPPAWRLRRAPHRVRLVRRPPYGPRWRAVAFAPRGVAPLRVWRGAGWRFAPLHRRGALRMFGPRPGRYGGRVWPR
jgi:hypothetical protein